MTSPIDAILDKAHFTLEDLLAEDDLIQECRSLNGRLINFLGNKENVKAMLAYMLSPTSADSAKRLSWQSCEIFCCEVDPIFTVLLENEDTMQTFFSILERNSPLDATTAGYFGRVMLHLLMRRSDTLTHYLMSHQEHLSKFIDHLEDTSVMDVLIRLLGADEQTNTQLPTSYVDWICETDALQNLMDKLDVSQMKRVQENAAQVLVSIIRSQPSPLAGDLAHGKNLDRLLKFLVGAEGQVSVPVLTVITTALDSRRRLVNGLRGIPTTADLEEMLDNSLFQPLAQKLLMQLPQLTEVLKKCGSNVARETPFGRLTPPLGMARLKVLEVLAILVNLKSETVMEVVMSSGALETCMDLFVKYPFHNVLHQHVVSIIANAINLNYQPMMEMLFTKLEFCQWLMNMPRRITSTGATQYVRSAESSAQKGGTLRAGYLAHVILLSNQISQAAEAHPFIAEKLRQVNAWPDYMQTIVLPINKREDLSSWICGRPTEISMKDGLDDHGDTEGPSSSNGVLSQNKFEEEENEDGDGSQGIQWRERDLLSSEGGSVSGTVAMFSRTSLREAATSRIVKEMSDSSSSTSSSGSSTDASSEDSSSCSSEEEEDNRTVMISPQTLLQNLTRDLGSGPGRRETEREASTSLPQEGLPSDPFNSFNFWKLQISDVDLPPQE